MSSLPRRNMYLTGFMGTGKSTVGRLLARRLGLPLRDLDDEIVADAGMSIPDIFGTAGEEAFRQREAEALARLARATGQIIATGGGAPVNERNRALMLDTGWLICLEAWPETICERLRPPWPDDHQQATRPLLDAPDPLARIRTLKNARQPVYAEAHWTVHTDLLTAEQVAEEIVRAVTLLERQATTGAAAGVAQQRGFRLGAKRFGRDRPLVCVPIVAGTCAEAIAQARQIASLAPDAVELRADYLTDLDPGAPARLSELLRQIIDCGVPVIFTNRAVWEGGARPWDEDTRLALIAAAIETGLPGLVDLELATAPPARDRLLAAARRRGVPVILSFHDFTATPDDDTLWAKLRAMEAAGADAAKLAVMPCDERDAPRLLALCRAATDGQVAIPVAAMAMGALGVVTRVLGHQAGSALTFAAAPGGQGSAPGQLALDHLRAYWAATAPAS